MSAISGGLSVQVSLCRVRWRTSLPAGFNRLPTGGIHQSETARHKAQERRGRLLPAHSSRQANRGIAQLMKVMLYAKRSTEAVSMTEAASILVDNAPFRRVAYSTWKALGAGDGSGPGPREPTPHSLPIFKKLNELCQKPTPNGRDRDRCQAPVYRVVSDLIERRARLLGDLIERYCHVSTSRLSPHYDQGREGHSMRLPPPRGGLFNKKSAATLMSHSETLCTATAAFRRAKNPRVRCKDYLRT